MNPYQNIPNMNTTQSAVKGILRVGRFSEQQQQPSSRIPGGFKESMIHVPMRGAAEPKSSSTSAQATGGKGAQARPAQQPPCKWKNSFKPIDQENPEDESQEQSSEERDELYEHFDPPELEDNDSLWDTDCDAPPEQDDNLEWQRLSPDRSCRGNPPWQLGQPLDIHDFSPESRPSESCVDSPGPCQLSERLAYSPNMKSMEPLGYGSTRRAFTPERRVDSSFGQQYSVSFEEERTNGEEEMTRPEYRRTMVPRVRLSSPMLQRDYEMEERVQAGCIGVATQQNQQTQVDPLNNMIPRVRLSSPPLQRDYEIKEKTIHAGCTGAATHQTQQMQMIPRVRLSSPPLQQDFEIEEPVKEEPEPSALAKRIKRKMRKSVRMDQITINCDLCDIEVSNGQELKKHLESKIHWDTMEHIQKHNTYDDMSIAFLQDVMLYKSMKCSRAIDYRALQALQENDHMTKVSLLHCAACQVLVSTSAAAVQNHITSPEHLSNTKEFDAQRRRASLDKADTIMKELRPQFENFIKGFSHFE
ncbi:uncharacterized protein LOC133411442 isoform X1 [Phycodurus eques]|uniref:uncharacterized protein LOC133411442 isoform X1 n=1 Tax=Phycodurus eques TaxID=693459 RepID=UPI002ACDE921|nr:uncharacterized protein LOC133411442 isoform X1 [Phycodurus eques]